MKRIHELFRENIVHLNIYLQDLSIVETQQTVAYDLTNFWCKYWHNHQDNIM